MPHGAALLWDRQWKRWERVPPSVAAGLLQCCFQPLLQIQNLLIQVGRLKSIMALGVLSKEERKLIPEDSLWRSVLPESPWDRRMWCSSPAKGAVLGRRDPERRTLLHSQAFRK